MLRLPGSFVVAAAAALLGRFEKSVGNLAFRGERESVLLSLRRALLSAAGLLVAFLSFLYFLPRRTIRRGVAPLRHFFSNA